MAIATVDTPPQDIVLNLRLSQEEAERLKALFQNPLEQDESKALRSIRETVWYALNEANVAS
jgi:predicted DNA-binding protein (UPF0251 family)